MFYFFYILQWILFNHRNVSSKYNIFSIEEEQSCPKSSEAPSL